MAVGGVATTSWLQGRPEARLAIEFDHYEGDIFEGIAESYRFLTSTLASS